MANTRARKPAPPTARDPLAIIAEARLPEATVPLCLRGDLQAELQAAALALAEAVKAKESHPGMAPGPELNTAIDAAQAKADDISAAMDAATVRFRFRGLTRKEFTRIFAAHPPRKGDEEDRKAGHNRDDVSRDYVRIGCVDPVLTGEAWDELEDRITVHQWGQLVAAVDQLTHQQATSVPFL